MKFITKIPSVPNNFKNLDGEYILSSRDSIYRLHYNGRSLAIEYLNRWTGAKIFSLSKINNLIIAGTEKGIVTFGKETFPIWTGYPTVIVRGNFHNKMKLALIKRASSKWGAEVVVSFLSTKDLLGNKKSIFQGISIPFRAAFEGPVGEFSGKILDKTVAVFDIDNDKYDEIIFVAPFPYASNLIIIDEDPKPKIQKLPTFFDSLINLQYYDVDGDGTKEIFVTTKDAQGFIRSAFIRVFNKEILDLQLIDSFNPSESLKNVVTDDGRGWGFIGRFTNTKLPEILYIWEEIPDPGEFRSHYWFFIKTFTGNLFIVNSEPYDDFSAVDFYISDIDNDGIDEVLLFSNIGIKLLKFENKEKKSVKTICHFNTPAQSEKIVASELGILFAGPILLYPNSIWGLYVIQDGKIIELLEAPSIKKIVDGNKSCLVLADNLAYLLQPDLSITPINRPLIDVVFDGQNYYAVDDDGNLLTLDVKGNVKEQIKLKDKRIAIGKVQDKIITISNKNNKSNIFINDLEEPFLVLTDPIYSISSIILEKSYYIGLFSEGFVDLVNLDTMKKIVRYEDPDISFNNYVIGDINNDHFSEILFLRDKRLKIIFTKSGDLIDYGNVEWTGIGLIREGTKERILCAHNSIIMKFDAEEIL
ncbi:MAG: hypothetical protein Q6351_007950 [Candidatus Njordarchaeum guaymaensis]